MPGKKQTQSVSFPTFISSFLWKASKSVAHGMVIEDVYLPANRKENEKLPVVIFAHGEGPEVFIKDAKDWGIYTL